MRPCNNVYKDIYLGDTTFLTKNTCYYGVLIRETVEACLMPKEPHA